MSDEIDTLREALAQRLEAEEAAVRELGDRIGYGRLMQAAAQGWRDWAAARGLAGSEFSIGPCAAFMVPCPCPPSGRDANGHCEWCCGARRVTRLVAETIVMLDGIVVALDRARGAR